ncbi:hypothetical protein ABID21_002944 [Pseudorhizobium tarimense]|uniref:DNA repair protein MmcB-related protein n=1 Tax=Pseudorhizobium tarimense TaxID=1079109 RepID=A0ABV2H8N5_9HYPH
MAILSIANSNPLIDGRQSARAMMVRRGLQILLHEMRHATLPELVLANGRRADLITVSEKGEIWIIEIKTSIEDFRVDRKWPDYRGYCDRLFFATHKDVPLDIFGRVRPASFGRLRRPRHARCAGAPAGGPDPKISNAQFCPGIGATADHGAMGHRQELRRNLRAVISAPAWPESAAASCDAC